MVADVPTLINTFLHPAEHDPVSAYRRNRQVQTPNRSFPVRRGFGDHLVGRLRPKLSVHPWTAFFASPAAQIVLDHGLLSLKTLPSAS